MSSLMGWVRQPTVLMGLGLVLGAGVFWLTGSEALALGAAAVPLGTIDDHTKALLGKIEDLETQMKEKK